MSIAIVCMVNNTQLSNNLNISIETRSTLSNLSDSCSVLLPDEKPIVSESRIRCK